MSMRDNSDSRRNVAAVILAAGGSTRLGRPKQLLPWGSTTLLGHVVDTVRSWDLEPIVVVLGHHARAVREAVDLTGTRVVVNEAWQQGMASSIRSGLAELVGERGTGAALIVLGDQPGISGEVVRAVIERAAGSPAPVVAPCYRGIRSNPVLVRRRLWDAFMQVSGDAGARSLLQSHPEWVDDVEVDAEPPSDTDTPGDLPESPVPG